MNLGLPQHRSSRQFMDSSGPDKRNSFSAQRYPVRLCKSAQTRSSRKPQSQAVIGKGESILIPSLPIASASRSELLESRNGSSPFLVRRESSIQRPPSLTLGETIERLTIAEEVKSKSEERNLSALASHSATEKEYQYLKRQWHHGADLGLGNPRQTSRCTCKCWNRSESIWRTFDGSIHLKLDPDATSSVKGVGYDHYRRYLRQLEKSRNVIEKRHLYREEGYVKAG